MTWRKKTGAAQESMVVALWACIHKRVLVAGKETI